MANPIKTMAEIIGKLQSDTNDVNQFPYCFSDTAVMVGWPLTPLAGLDFVKCRFVSPRAKRFSSLGGGACFLSNRNTGGEIELRFLQGAFSLSHLELFGAAGIPIPMVVSDISSGGTASVIGTGCRIVDYGDFTRAEKAPNVTMKLEADRMILFHGLRLPVFDV